jgi:hypothetical protein
VDDHGTGTTATYFLLLKEISERISMEEPVLQRAVQATWVIYVAMHPEAGDADERQCSRLRAARTTWKDWYAPALRIWTEFLLISGE